MVAMIALTGIGCRTSEVSVREYCENDMHAVGERPLKIIAARIDGPANSETFFDKLEVDIELIEPAMPVENNKVSENVLEAARTRGADYVFLYSGNLNSELFHHAASFSNLRSAGKHMSVVTRVRTVGKAQGILIDVQTGNKVLTVNSELAKTMGYPVFISESKSGSVLAGMEKELFAGLAGNLAGEMERI